MDSKQELVQNLLNNSETFLGSICSKLSPTASDNVSVEQAYKDFRREKVLFNGIPFVPQKDMICLDIFANTLTNFVERMLRIDPSCVAETLSKDSNRSKETSDTILKRSCRTSAGSESFFLVQSHFCPDGTFLIQRSGSHDGDGEMDAPIRIEAYLSPLTADRDSGSICSGTDSMDQTSVSSIGEYRSSLLVRSEIINGFSVIDISSMEQQEENGEAVRPWLEIDTIITDESNLRTGEHNRSIQLIVFHPQMKRYLLPNSWSNNLFGAHYFPHRHHHKTHSPHSIQHSRNHRFSFDNQILENSQSIYLHRDSVDFDIRDMTWSYDCPGSANSSNRSNSSNSNSDDNNTTGQESSHCNNSRRNITVFDSENRDVSKSLFSTEKREEYGPSLSSISTTITINSSSPSRSKFHSFYPSNIEKSWSKSFSKVHSSSKKDGQNQAASFSSGISSSSSPVG